jgi:hypothetical protein
MAYLTYNEYAAMGGGVSETDFPAFDTAAENLIDVATKFAAIDGLENFPARVQTLFKKAIVAEIDYLSIYGLEFAYTGAKPQGFRVGEVSVTNHSTRATSEEKSEFSALSPVALSILEQTGLMSRHVQVVGDPFAPYPLGVF